MAASAGYWHHGSIMKRAMTSSLTELLGKRRIWVALALSVGLLAVLVWQIDLETGGYFLRAEFLGQ